MIDSATLELLRSMKLSAMASELKKQLADPGTYGNLGFEERIALLVDAEWARRQANKLTKYIHNAKLAIPSAVIEDIEYYEDRHLDKAQIQRLATCKYIDEGHHIIFKGDLPCLRSRQCCLQKVQDGSVYPYARAVR